MICCQRCGSHLGQGLAVCQYCYCCQRLEELVPQIAWRAGPGSLRVCWLETRGPSSGHQLKLTENRRTFRAVRVTSKQTPRGYALTETLDEVVGIPRSLSTALTVRPVVATITVGL
jgi:hypothetical protein